MSVAKEIIKVVKQDPLGEAFLVEALSRYAKDVLQDDSDWGNSIISKEAWQHIANEVLSTLN
jgi:hypothetical protein